MTPEGKVQAHLKKRMSETGGTFRKMRWEGRVGAPDAFIFWDGPIFALAELKRQKGVTAVMQTREHDRLRKAGFKVFVPKSIEEVDAMINSLLQQTGCV